MELKNEDKAKVHNNHDVKIRVKFSKLFVSFEAEYSLV